MSRLIIAFVICLYLFHSNSLRAQQAMPDDKTAGKTEDIVKKKGRRTLGGMQFWTDYLVCHGWRIQHNVMFGNFRLLKPSNQAIQSGSYQSCLEIFAQVVDSPKLPKLDDEIVITIHGLGRTRKSMAGLNKYLAEHMELTAINVGYSSTRRTVSEHARALNHVIKNLVRIRQRQEQPGRLKLHFVGHSLGNIIIRHVLFNVEKRDAAPEWDLGRIVMLAPPNQGSAMATLLKKNKAFRLIAGNSGKDLALQWQELEKKLATPSCPFGIIAGGRGNNKGYNPWLDGDDDIIVTVEETKLPGAVDFLVHPSIHTYIMEQKDVQKATLQFLQKGYFKSPDERNPIPKSN